MPEPLDPHIPYRRDIDGLRALAVLSVLLYHFGMPGVPGGFVGVDVFFVISGYLIGGILWREYLATGSVSLKRFYIRRFRRLAPAWFAMSAVSLLVAWAVFLPFEFREFGKALIASTVYLSNVQFYRSAGYFDTAADEKALLHTWSLSVEEQFYIFLPLTILLLARSRGALSTVLFAIFAASLAACVLLTRAYPVAAFYLFPFRAWELLAGVLLAMRVQNGPMRASAWRSWIGLGLVLGGVMFLRPSEAFPGTHALLPVVGTILLIANGTQDNLVNRVLGARPVVAIGLISYSLYLWHWPVLVFSTYWRGGFSGWYEAALWAGFSLVLAGLSWRYIEEPVRRARALPAPRVFGAMAAGSAVMLMAGAVLFLRDGLPGRFGPEVRPHVAASADFLQDWSRCGVPDDGPLRGIEVCPIGPEGPPVMVIWGDSHVRAFKEGLDLAAHELNRPAWIIWRAGCPPLFGIEKQETAASPSEDAACGAANRQIAAALPQIDTARKILLIGRWSYYSTGQGTGADARNRISLRDGSDLPQDRAVVLSAQRTVSRLLEDFDEVAVLRQVPEIADYGARRMARDLAHGHLTPAGAEARMRASYEQLRPRAEAAEAPWQPLAEAGAITWIDPWTRLCADGVCHALIDGEGYYFDNNHLTNTAARNLRSLFEGVLTGDNALRAAGR